MDAENSLSKIRCDLNPPAFNIRNIPIFGNLILAPMDGYSDLPFRSLCRRLGSSMSYTGFISAIDVLKDQSKLALKLLYLPSERPVVFQLFDSDPDRLVDAAIKIMPLGPDIIDINMGCSVRCVSGRGAGAGLLRDPKKVGQIFSSLSRCLESPVTAKIRLGWDDDSRNHRLIARVIEENGGALIAVHGRTRNQGYCGYADWEAIAEVCQTVSIPVIANGDVNCVEDIDRISQQTGCQAVMIGRAAVGNPWIFSRVDRNQVSYELLIRTINEHFESMISFYGQDQGLIRFRKHASRYIESFNLAPATRRRLLNTPTYTEFLELLATIYA